MKKIEYIDNLEYIKECARQCRTLAVCSANYIDDILKISNDVDFDFIEKKSNDLCNLNSISIDQIDRIINTIDKMVQQAIDE